MEFNKLNLKESILRTLDELGLTTLTPIQEDSYPVIESGLDLLGEAPTGTGKTFAFVLPMIEKIDTEYENVQALIMCPTRELVQQGYEEIQKVLKHTESIRCVSIYGGQSMYLQVKALKKRPHIIIGTPGRLFDHIDRRTIRCNHIKYLVLDEADVMLDMGFKPQIEKIINEITNVHQTIMFSATINRNIEKLSKEFQKPDRVFIRTNTELVKPKINQYFITTSEDDKKQNLVNLLNSQDFERCFVFCRTKRKVEKVYKLLQDAFFDSVYLHGDLTQRERTQSMGKFKNNETKILIATDIAARGIDVSNVDIVINYDLPDEDEYYLHRIGRVGRANKEGDSFSFISKRGKNILKVYETLTDSNIKEYVVDESTSEEMKMTRILENLKKLDLSKTSKEKELIEGFKKTYLEENGVELTDLEVASLLLKASLSIERGSDEGKVTRRDNDYNSKREERDNSRRPRRENEIEFAKIPDSQRFFINIGQRDGLTTETLMHFIEKYSGITKDQFADVYLKDTFSFFELGKEHTELVMEKINNEQFGEREVHVELSEGKASKSYEEKSSSRRGGGSYGSRDSSRGYDRRGSSSRSSGGEGRSYSRRPSSEGSSEPRPFLRKPREEGTGEKRSYTRRSDSAAPSSSFGGEKRSYTRRSDSASSSSYGSGEKRSYFRSSSSDAGAPKRAYTRKTTSDAPRSESFSKTKFGDRHPSGRAPRKKSY